MKYEIPHFERSAAIVCSLVGLYSVSSIWIQFSQHGLRFSTSFVLTTPIFYIGLMCWIFWLSRAIGFGGYRYSFVGWWLCAVWHSFLVLAAIISIIGIVLLALSPIGTALAVVAAAASVGVVMYFMMDREEKRHLT